jgi:hypothetical protein
VFGVGVWLIQPPFPVGNVGNPASFAGFPKRGGNGGRVPGLDFSSVSTARHFPQGIGSAHLAGHSGRPFPLPSGSLLGVEKARDQLDEL